MRNQSIKFSFVKPIIDYANSGTLTVSSSAYTSGDYLHSSVINFNVFQETFDSAVKIVGIKVREIITAGSLAKKAFKLRLFNFNDMTVIANDNFDFTDGTLTSIENLLSTISVVSADYDEVTSKEAIMEKNLITPIYIPNYSSGRYLYGIAVTTDTTAYDATAEVSIELTYEAL